MDRRLWIHVTERDGVIIFPNNLRRNLAPDNFFKDCHRSSPQCALTNETAQLLELRRRAQPFADEADYFLAQRIARPRPGLRTSQMFYARLQIAEQHAIRARVHQRADSFFQSVEKLQLVSRAR